MIHAGLNLPCRTLFPGVTSPVLTCRRQRRLRGTSGPATPACSRRRRWTARPASPPRPWLPLPMSLSPLTRRAALSLPRAPPPPWPPSTHPNPLRGRLAGGGGRRGGSRPLCATGSLSWKTCRWTPRRKRPQSLSRLHRHESVASFYLLPFPWKLHWLNFPVKHKCRGGRPSNLPCLSFAPVLQHIRGGALKPRQPRPHVYTHVWPEMPFQHTAPEGNHAQAPERERHVSGNYYCSSY